MAVAYVAQASNFHQGDVTSDNTVSIVPAAASHLLLGVVVWSLGTGTSGTTTVTMPTPAGWTLLGSIDGGGSPLFSSTQVFAFAYRTLDTSSVTLSIADCTGSPVTNLGGYNGVLTIDEFSGVTEGTGGGIVAGTAPLDFATGAHTAVSGEAALHAIWYDTFTDSTWTEAGDYTGLDLSNTTNLADATIGRYDVSYASTGAKAGFGVASNSGYGSFTMPFTVYSQMPAAANPANISPDAQSEYEKIRVGAKAFPFYVDTRMLRGLP